MRFLNAAQHELPTIVSCCIKRLELHLYFLFHLKKFGFHRFTATCMHSLSTNHKRQFNDIIFRSDWHSIFPYSPVADKYRLAEACLELYRKCVYVFGKVDPKYHNVYQCQVSLSFSNCLMFIILCFTFSLLHCWLLHVMYVVSPARYSMYTFTVNTTCTQCPILPNIIQRVNDFTYFYSLTPKDSYLIYRLFSSVHLSFYYFIKTVPTI